MLRLTSASLAVDLLDPIVDAARLGPRFCAGGFIWQVYHRAADSTLAPLLAGPEWPSTTPAPFNAQGLPESFRHRTRDGAALTWSGSTGLAIGAGTLASGENNSVILAEPCAWQITTSGCTATFVTRQATAGFACELTRDVTITSDTIVSATTLTNTGPRPLALQWFAHPFWALTAGRARVALPAGTTLPENPGFALAPDGTLTFRRPFVAPDDSQFVLLTLPHSPSLSLSLDHPLLSRVTFDTNFTPTECPVWANSCTASVEPYLTLNLAPGETRHWHLRHGFIPR